MKAWYDEGENYDYNNFNFSMTTAYFTQVIWRETRLLGVGMVKKGLKAYVVALYYPAGNKKGLFKENVLPPIK